MTDYNDSPTWEELDAICKGKSAMDLAEEIWWLRRDGSKGKSLTISRWVFVALKRSIYPHPMDSSRYEILKDDFNVFWRHVERADRTDATRHQLVEGEVETVKDVYRKWGKDDVR